MRDKILAVVLLAFSAVLFPAAPVQAQQQPQPDRRFKAWDRDGDNRLKREELPEALRRNFARVDADKDGFISVKEHLDFTRQRQRQAAPAGRFDGVQVMKDIPYAANENPRQTLDLFLPKNKGDKPVPLVAFIHGGGWRAGSKDGGLRRVGRLVQSGEFAGASIGYRLSGEAQWPAQIHDCKAAVRWLKAHAKKYGYDADRICVFGTSAGGHLVAMLGVSADVKPLEGALGEHLQQSSSVACVINFFGPSNLLTMNDQPGRMDHNAATSPESLLVGGAIQKNKDKARNASPATHVTAGDAPMLLMHGTKDPLVPFDQSVQLHKLLQAAKVDAVLVPVKDGGHGFGGKEVDQRVDQFLQKHLLGKEVKVSEQPIELK